MDVERAAPRTTGTTGELPSAVRSVVLGVAMLAASCGRTGLEVGRVGPDVETPDEQPPETCGRPPTGPDLEGPCAAFDRACGEVEGLDCGGCEPGASCVGGRCKAWLGPTAPAKAHECDLIRGVHPGFPEGERLRPYASGLLETIQVALWVEEAVEEVIVEIWGSECGSLQLRRELVVPAESFPAYAIGYHSPVPTTSITIDPPVPVAAGDVVDVVFRPAQGVIPICHLDDDDESTEATFHYELGGATWDLENANATGFTDVVARLAMEVW